MQARIFNGQSRNGGHGFHEGLLVHGEFPLHIGINADQANALPAAMSGAESTETKPSALADSGY